MQDFVLEKSAKNFRKFCNQVTLSESSDNSEGACNFKESENSNQSVGQKTSHARQGKREKPPK